MEILNGIKNILMDILDIEGLHITEETYLVRDLGAESIDLLELAVSLNAKFKTEINDNVIYLKQLRLFVDDANRQKNDVPQYLSEKYPFLSHNRIKEILTDINGGPVLKVKDLVSYVKWQRR
jgi:acyl carrier protein